MDPIDDAEPDAARACDEAALADLHEGRVVACETVVQWLGGWPVAQGVGDREPDRAPKAVGRIEGGEGREAPRTVVWTATAIDACRRTRAILTAYGPAGDARFAANLVATIVRLIVDGPGADSGIVDLPLAPPLSLRVLVEHERVAVLGLHWHGVLH